MESTKTEHDYHYSFIEDKENTSSSCFSEIMEELKSLLLLAFPIALTALIFYSRSIVSMLFLGHLGDLQLAAGSLAIALANITGYSVLSGLALGMEPLCSQAFGANRPKLLSLTLHRCIIFLLLSSLPISLLWLNISAILRSLHQHPDIATLARTYLLFSLPDLVTNSFLHPIRIYLRAQGITHPLTQASLAGTLLHLPFNYILVTRLRFGVAGPLLRLAAPSCLSVCLEWWWYEIMIVLCGLLMDPTATVASMGVLIQTTSFIYVFPSSLGFAVSTRVGNELGANRPFRAKLSAVVSVFLSAMMGFSAMVFATAMRHMWGRMFTTDKDILRLTSAALPILGLCEIGNCPQTVGCGVVRGTARPSMAANVNLSAFYLVGMPVAVGLGFWLDVGFRGLWLGLLSAQVCCAGLMLYVIGTTEWEYEAQRAQLLTLADDVEGNDSGVDDDGRKVSLTGVATVTPSPC
ncbi:protein DETOXIFICATION 51 [Arachis duranensis]|uniref:Protein DETOXIFICATION n=1 Tax=Arachis duranensis TaxID=130453 RepID=A0A6P4CST8_ARADU|nr:protein DETOXIFICATION 51 [Arachis duranensis]